jgi:hypothetical protein
LITEEIGHEIICDLYPLLEPEPYLGDLQKHQQHDQQSHGNWAAGSSLSGSNSMPYEWKPKLPSSAEKLDDETYQINLEIFKNVAEAPVAIRVYASDFEDIVFDGKFKTLKDILANKPYRAGDYQDARNELEHSKWGIPEGKQPVYGYLDTNYDGHVPDVGGYGDIKITLKDSVKNRTTFVANDSLNTKAIPILINDAKTKNLSKSAVSMANIYGFTPDAHQYYEAQVHGGVSLKDIKSVTRTSQYSVDGVPFYMPFNTEISRILRENNIEVLVEEGTKVSRYNG